MIKIRRLNISDHAAIRNLTAAVKDALTNDLWFIPMPEETMDSMFDAQSTLNVYGAFVDDELAAVALIDTDPLEMADLLKCMSLSADKPAAELGACMVHPDFRGNNLMYMINRELVCEAKKMGLSYLVASAHPDNIASNSSLKKLGMKHTATLIRGNNYLRNAYCLLLGNRNG